MSDVRDSIFHAMKAAHTIGLNYRDTMKLAQEAYICFALSSADENQCEAARSMGVHRNTLQRMLGAKRKRVAA